MAADDVLVGAAEELVVIAVDELVEEVGTWLVELADCAEDEVLGGVVDMELDVLLVTAWLDVLLILVLLVVAMLDVDELAGILLEVLILDVGDAMLDVLELVDATEDVV